MSLKENILKHFNISETKANIIENLSWSIIGKTVNLLSGLLIGIIVARYLGPEQYGLMNYVISYTFLFQIVATFGLDSIEIREEAKENTDRNTIIGTAFWIKVVLGITCMAMTIITSFLIEDDGYTVALITLYSMTIVLNAFSVIKNYFMAIVENKYVVKSEISRTAICILLKLALLWLNASLTWFIIASIADVLLLSSGYIIAYRHRAGDLCLWTYDRPVAKYLLKEAFPLLLTSTAVIVYQRIDQVMIGQMIDNKSVGFFSVASKFVEVILYVPIMLSQTITPILVKIRDKDEAAYAQKGQMFMNVSLWATFAVSILTSLSAYWIVRITYGEAYLPAVAILQVMSFKAASVALSSTAGAMLVTEQLQRYAIYRDLIGCVVCISLNYLLLPRYGVIAAAYIAIASNVFAGYISDALIPPFRHLFVRQTKALFIGWKDLIYVKNLIK